MQGVRWKNWKLHFPHEYNSVKVPGKDGKQGIEIEKKIGLSLFDLSNDPEEKINVADKHPDIVKKMSEMGEAFDKELKKDARPCGRVEGK